jgi:tetratricopeptide (TPR) repeat protein
MSSNQQDHSESLNPKSFIGRRLVFDGVEYALASFLTMGMEKIVYELRNLETGAISYVLKIYRERKSEEQISEIKTIYHRIREALGEVALETHYVSIDGWLAEIQRHLSPPDSDILLFDGHVGGFLSNLSSDKPEVRRITELYLSRNFEDALAESEIKLEEFPLKPDYLAIKGGALLGLNRVEEALSTLELCIEIEPDEARHYFNLAVAEDKAGHLAYALALAYQASTLANDTPEIWSFLFDLEVFLGHIDAASHILQRLNASSLSPSHLSKLRDQLAARSNEISRIEEEMKVAWDLYDKEDLDGALRISDDICEKDPSFVRALFLSGIIAVSREQWDQAIIALGRAQGLDMENQDVTFYLGYAEFMNDDLETSSARHLFWLHQYLDAIYRIKELVPTSGEESGNEIILEREIDIHLVRTKERIKDQCSTLQDLYCSICTPMNSLKTKIEQIKQGLEALTSTMVDMGL